MLYFFVNLIVREIMEKKLEGKINDKEVSADQKKIILSEFRSQFKLLEYVDYKSILELSNYLVLVAITITIYLIFYCLYPQTIFNGTFFPTLFLKSIIDVSYHKYLILIFFANAAFYWFFFISLVEYVVDKQMTETHRRSIENFDD